MFHSALFLLSVLACRGSTFEDSQEPNGNELRTLHGALLRRDGAAVDREAVFRTAPKMINETSRDDWNSFYEVGDQAPVVEHQGTEPEITLPTMLFAPHRDNLDASSRVKKDGDLTVDGGLLADGVDPPPSGHRVEPTVVHQDIKRHKCMIYLNTPMTIINRYSHRRLYAWQGFSGRSAFGASSFDEPIFDDHKWIFKRDHDQFTITNYRSGRRLYAAGGEEEVGVGADNPYGEEDRYRWEITITSHDLTDYCRITNLDSHRRLYAWREAVEQSGVGASAAAIPHHPQEPDKDAGDETYDANWMYYWELERADF